MQESISAFSDYWSRLTTMYPTPLRGAWLATTEPDHLHALTAHRVASVNDVIQRAASAARDTAGGARGAGGSDLGGQA